MRIIIFLPALQCISLVIAQDSSEELSVSDPIQKMAANLYLEEVKISPNQNVVLSPLSIHMAMSILYFGAEGTSRQQLENALGLEGVSEKDHLEKAKMILDKYQYLNDENITLNIANAMYVAKDFEVKSEFKDLMENQFDAQIDNLDFSDSKHAVKVVNSWAANKTNNLINKLVSEEGLDMDVRMVLLNAVYFKAKWLTPFDEKHTRKGNFTVPNKGQIETDFMFTSTSLESAFIDELNATLVVLPYTDRDYNMLIFLPEESRSVEDLETTLFNSSKPTMIEQHLMQLKKKETDLLFPKFDTGSDISLVRHFQQLGVTDIFGDRANFTGISDENDAAVGDIVHKTKIEVSEEGSEAAAVTAVFNTKVFFPNPKISIDRPFIFFIFDTKNSVPIFMGKIVDPSNGETVEVEEKEYMTIVEENVKVTEEDVKPAKVDAETAEEDA